MLNAKITKIIAQMINETIRAEVSEQDKITILTENLPTQFAKAVRVPVEVSKVWFHDVAKMIGGAI